MSHVAEPLDFQKQLAFGQVGENYLGRWLMSKGWIVEPVYEVEGLDNKGPRIFMPSGRSLIAPDIRARYIESGDWYRFEAKRKTVFSWHRITQRWVTGIDLYQYRQYIQVQELTDELVWLCFLHCSSETTEHDGKSPTGLYAGRLDKLQDCENHRHENWGKTGMVYWSVDNLQKLAELNQILRK